MTDMLIPQAIPFQKSTQEISQQELARIIEWRRQLEATEAGPQEAEGKVNAALQVNTAVGRVFREAWLKTTQRHSASRASQTPKEK